ncbi:MAG: hypothetical protein ACRD3J_13060, partial [Thermoanaerobaculia bacterium]
AVCLDTPLPRLSHPDHATLAAKPSITGQQLATEVDASCCFNVSLTSMVISTPNPSCSRAAGVLLTASSYPTAPELPSRQLSPASMTSLNKEPRQRLPITIRSTASVADVGGEALVLPACPR